MPLDLTERQNDFPKNDLFYKNAINKHIFHSRVEYHFSCIDLFWNTLVCKGPFCVSAFSSRIDRRTSFCFPFSDHYLITLRFFTSHPTTDNNFPPNLHRLKFDNHFQTA